MAEPQGMSNGQQSPPDISQAGAIAGAVLAALLAADPLDLRSRSRAFKVLDYASFGFWIAAVVLFLLVLTLPSHRRLHSVRGTIAAFCVAVGGILTLTSIALLPFSFSEDTDIVAVSLTPASRSALDTLCGTKGKQLVGKIATATLNDPFVTITLRKSSSKACDQVRVPAGAIRALREHPGKKRR